MALNSTVSYATIIQTCILTNVSWVDSEHNSFSFGKPLIFSLLTRSESPLLGTPIEIP